MEKLTKSSLIVFKKIGNLVLLFYNILIIGSINQVHQTFNHSSNLFSLYLILHRQPITLFGKSFNLSIISMFANY